MKALIVGFLAFCPLVSFTSEFVWVPYKFKLYERYIYDYSEVFKEKRGFGSFEVVIEKRGENFRVSIVGGYRGWNGAIKTEVMNDEELSGFILMKMYFDRYWLIPLGRTILSRGLVKLLTKKRIDWTLGRFKVDKETVRVVRRCAYGNLKGRMLEVLRRGERVFALCASPKASMPIYLYRKTEGGDSFEIKLVEYSDLK